MNMEMLRIITAEYLCAYLFCLEFNDGTFGEADISQELWGEVFEPLKDDDYVAEFHIENGTLEWPNGADLAPEFLYELVEKINLNFQRNEKTTDCFVVGYLRPDFLPRAG